jgi:hypothetical protein
VYGNTIENDNGNGNGKKNGIGNGQEGHRRSGLKGAALPAPKLRFVMGRASPHES